MNKLYVLFALMASTVILSAQITVTSASFPAAGDTLKYATDFSPSGVTITPAGAGAATWDFTSLAPNINSETVFQAANTGAAFAEFPTATLVSIGAGGQSETYYNAAADGFYNLGFYGSDPTGGGLPVQTAFHFTPPVPERRSPMNFFDFNQAESSLNIAFSVADLGPLADSLGPLAGLADSIRIRGVATRLDLVDSYGSLSIPGGTYDVLREKRSEYRETRLDIHTFLGWQDITDLLLGGAGGGIAEGLGKDTVITYVFVSNTEKEIIASVNTGSDGQTPQSVEYKDNGIPNAVGDVVGAAQKVTVSPNPATSTTVFSLKNLAPGNYSMQLMDANGQQVLRSKLSGTETSIHLDGLSNGTYFYQVFDESQRRVATGKLLIINH